MACVTLKRSLDFDPIHHGSSSCSPRPAKRRRCMPMCMPIQNVDSSSIFQSQSQSPFLEATPRFSAEEIEKNVRDSIRRIKRRKIANEKTMDYEGYESPTSPPQSPPMSDPSSPLSAHLAAALSNSSTCNKDKPIFTFRQVHLLVEQLIREREKKIREDYEKVLSHKLAEQYDCFVRFTTDQITQKISQAELPSYLS